MTPDEVKALSDEELRVKVAELCGWLEIKNEYYHDDNRPSLMGYDGEEMRMGRFYEGVPNYPADLNACADFSKHLRTKSRELYTDYTRHLDKLVAIANSEDEADSINISDALPRTRCAAFILTMEGAK